MIITCNSFSPEKLWKDANYMLENDKLKESVILLKKIIEDYPEHKYSVKSQFKIAKIYLNDKKEYDIAIEEFNKVIKNYPSSQEAMNSLFMIGYIYNNNLNAYSDAIRTYNLFLKKFPDDELIPSVNYELENLKKHKNEIDSLNNLINNKYK